MSHEVIVDGKRLTLHPARALGKGGEADVFDLGDGRALKVWKAPDHPDLVGLPDEQRAAEARIQTHQRKLPAFPSGLPASVVGPSALAKDAAGRRIVGYAMRKIDGIPLLRWAEPSFRRTYGRASVIAPFFRALHTCLTSLHACGVIVGDFNDRNVLVDAAAQPLVIDTDSFQFGTFPCLVYTEAFVDPRLCDPAAHAPLLVRPYDAAADWFAFAALLFQSLLLVGPFGGVHRPPSPKGRVPPGERPLRGITVMAPDVVYPKPAIPFATLPEPLLQHFHEVFARGERRPFPLHLLDGLRFHTCPRCGLEHARLACPSCAKATVVPGLQPPALTVSGEIQCTRLFATGGVIVHVAFEGGRLRVVHHEDGAYRRETGARVLEAPLSPELLALACGDETVLARGTEVTVVARSGETRRRTVDEGPAVACSAERLYFVAGGRLEREARSAFAPDATIHLGDVLPNQTRIWAGATFGIGMYRAGRLTRAFVFETERRALNDGLELPPIPGEITFAHATLDDGHAWLELSFVQAGRTRHLCLVYSRLGRLVAASEAASGDGTWLATKGGRCAARGMLFAATDEGLVRVEVAGGALRVTRTFAATAGIVDAASQLVVTDHGIAVVGRKEVHLVTLR